MIGPWLSRKGRHGPRGDETRRINDKEALGGMICLQEAVLTLIMLCSGRHGGKLKHAGNRLHYSHLGCWKILGDAVHPLPRSDYKPSYILEQEWEAKQKVGEHPQP